MMFSECLENQILPLRDNAWTEKSSYGQFKVKLWQFVGRNR